MPLDLDGMDKAELLKVQWQVGDKPSLDTAIKVETYPQHVSLSGVRTLSDGNAVKETVQATNGRLTRPITSFTTVLRDCLTAARLMATESP